MKMTSTTDLAFPGLPFAIRQGEVKDLPADPEAAAFIVASVYSRGMFGIRVYLVHGINPYPEHTPSREVPEL
jgi:hypothetical protein